MKEIHTNDVLIQPFYLWQKKWLLLTSGDMNTFNTMTIAWGSIGVMWNKPFIQAVVRPCRYTYQFMENYTSFTVCSFPEIYRDALTLLGTKSGKNTNKIAESGLHSKESTKVEAPCFAEATLVIECVKMYWQDMNCDNFLNPSTHTFYPQKDYHRIYFGEILTVLEADS